MGIAKPSVVSALNGQAGGRRSAARTPGQGQDATFRTIVPPTEYPTLLHAGRSGVRSQITKDVVPCRVPGLNIAGKGFMFSNSLVQQALMRLTQRLLIELLRDLLPELLNETNAILGRKLSEGFDDLLRIHLQVVLAATLLLMT